MRLNYDFSPTAPSSPRSGFVQPGAQAGRRESAAPLSSTLCVLVSIMVRVRISSVILGVGLLGYPWAIYLFPVPHLFRDGSTAEFVLNWLLYDFSALLIVVGFMVSCITVVVLAVGKKWRSIPQHILEVVVCLVCILFLPAY